MIDDDFIGASVRKEDICLAQHVCVVFLFLATKKIVNVFFRGQCQHTEKSCSLRGRRYAFLLLVPFETSQPQSAFVFSSWGESGRDGLKGGLSVEQGVDTVSMCNLKALMGF